MRVKDFIFKTNKKRFIFYILALFIYTALFIYIDINNDVHIYNPRLGNSYNLVDAHIQTIQDESLPAGIKNKYSFPLKDINKTNNCVIFYTAHDYVEAYIEDELVYSLTTTGQIATSPTAIWNYIPYDHSDEGKNMTIIITPIFDEVKDKSIHIYTGSFYTFMFDEIIRELPELILAACSICTGLTIMFVQFYIYINKKIKNLDNIYLAAMAILIGIWKMADIRIAPLLFSNSSHTMGYIALGTLFLASIPVLLHIKNHFKKSGTYTLDLVTGISIGVCGFAWLFQVMNYKDFRETLIFAHLVMIISILSIIITILVNRKRVMNDVSLRRSLIFPVIIIVGILIDLYQYYLNDSSYGLFFTLLTFLIYIILAFIRNIRLMNRKIYIDQTTRLYNKYKWNELLNDNTSLKKPYGCITIDLNGLKTINDTYGHSTGNIIISDFAEILKHSIHYNCDIYRWGGDEFVIIVEHCTKTDIEHVVENIINSVTLYNDSHPISISFAYGYVYSNDYSEFDLKKLFSIADEKMYAQKKKWYEKQN